jgi:hypothetical protein
MISNSTLAEKIPSHVLNPCLDFLSSAISTFTCSVVSTPQMVLTDRIMAGVYPHFIAAVYHISTEEGMAGFYRGWLPALVQKIPSYALTWMFYQQIRFTFSNFMLRTGSTLENTLFGGLAAAAACCVMIPVDTVKTRIVMQTSKPSTDEQIYRGILDTFSKVYHDEGIRAFYRALPPRLCSVVPMIGIQFAVYELIKRILLQQPPPKRRREMSDNNKNVII